MTSLEESGDVRELFDAALPAGKGSHVLALGEVHYEAGHLHFLKDNLDNLRNQHCLGTIGQEMPYFMNMFLWAYRDGNLPVPADKSADYLHKIFNAYYYPVNHDNSEALGDLAMAALERNMRVVCFDTRCTLSEYGDSILRKCAGKSFRDMLEHTAQKERLSETELLEMFRQDTAKIPEMLVWETQKAVPLLQLAALGHLAEHKDRLPEYRIYFQTENLPHALSASALDEAWMHHEARLLLEQHPEYQKRLDAMESMILEGRVKGLPEDAMSSVIFHSSMDRERNAITIHGFHHLLGINNESLQVQGTTDLHMQSMPGIRQVSRAVVASTSTVADALKHHMEETKLSVQRTLPSLYNLETGRRVHAAPHDGQGLPTPEDRYGGPNDRWMNPLADPEMKERAAHVRELEDAAYTCPPHTKAHMEHHRHDYLVAQQTGIRC